MPHWFALLVLVGVVPKATPDTPFNFASVYLHEIAAIESYRAQAAANQSRNPKDMTSCIHDTEAWRLEIASAANVMKTITLPPDNLAKEAPGLIADGLDTKSQLVGTFGDLCAAFAGGPQEGVDYQKLAASAPRVRAQLEATDKALFQASALAFATLISNKPDEAGHVSFLVLTAGEKAKLLKQIEDDFGKNKNATNQGYADETAQLFRNKLNEYHTVDQRPQAH